MKKNKQDTIHDFSRDHMFSQQCLAIILQFHLLIQSSIFPHQDCTAHNELDQNVPCMILNMCAHKFIENDLTIIFY
jgi:hypothetical protein